MTVRNNVYAQFGPHLTEAIVTELHEEINELRENAGLPTMPIESFLGKLHNNLNHSPPFDFESEDPHG